MSEKRFILRTNSVSINYPSGRIFDNKKQHSLYLNEVVGLLNEQQATIEKLERKLELKTEEVEYLKRMMVKWGAIVKQLNEENRELRKELNRKDCRKCGNYCRDKALDYCLVDERDPHYFSPLEWDYEAEAEKCKYYYR